MSQPAKVPQVFYAVFDKEGREVARFDTEKAADKFVRLHRYSVQELLFAASETLLPSGTDISGPGDESPSKG